MLVAADVAIITMHIVRYRLVLRPCLGGPGDDRDRQLLLRRSLGPHFFFTFNCIGVRLYIFHWPFNWLCLVLYFSQLLVGLYYFFHLLVSLYVGRMNRCR
jgi:hypothetical protein